MARLYLPYRLDQLPPPEQPKNLAGWSAAPRWYLRLQRRTFIAIVTTVVAVGLVLSLDALVIGEHSQDITLVNNTGGRLFLHAVLKRDDGRRKEIELGPVSAGEPVTVRFDVGWMPTTWLFSHIDIVAGPSAGISHQSRFRSQPVAWYAQHGWRLEFGDR